VIIPRGDTVLQEKDSVVLGALPFEEHEKIILKESLGNNMTTWQEQRF